MIAVLWVVACGGSGKPRAQDAAAAPAASSPPAVRCAPDDVADRGLSALVGQGLALSDHIGPAAAAAIDADLAARPAVYLARFGCLYVDRDLGPALASLLVVVPLWKLRAADPAAVRTLATRLGHRYDELTRLPADPDDPGRSERIADAASAVALLRDGIDVPMAASWTAVPASDVSACITATLDAATVVRVSRRCSCGEPLGCTATASAGGLALDVRFDPDALAVCTDCYQTSTACTLPRLPASAAVDVSVGGAALTRWSTDTLGRPTAPICR